MSSDTTSTASRGLSHPPIPLRLAHAVAAILAVLAVALVGPTGAGPAGVVRADPGGGSDETRTVHTRGELLIRQLDQRLAGRGISLEDRTKIIVAQRNALRSWARNCYRLACDATEAGS